VATVMDTPAERTLTKVRPVATLEMKYEVVTVAVAVAASPLPDPGYRSASDVHVDSNRIDS